MVSSIVVVFKKNTINMTFSTVMIECLSYSERTFQNGITCITNTCVLFVYYKVRTCLMELAKIVPDYVITQLKEKQK